MIVAAPIVNVTAGHRPDNAWIVPFISTTGGIGGGGGGGAGGPGGGGAGGPGGGGVGGGGVGGGGAGGEGGAGATGAASSITGNDWPPAVRRPDRCGPVLGSAVSEIVALALPLAADVTRSQAESDVTFQAQPLSVSKPASTRPPAAPIVTPDELHE